MKSFHLTIFSSSLSCQISRLQFHLSRCFCLERSCRQRSGPRIVSAILLLASSPHNSTSAISFISLHISALKELADKSQVHGSFLPLCYWRLLQSLLASPSDNLISILMGKRKFGQSSSAMEIDGDTSTISLQSKDHEELLNIIDDLRSQGISRYIDLPQLVVCGDQSSGKSSVLEAISGLQFPTKDNLCTRFATELILRRGGDVKAEVTIIPDVSRPDDEKAKLLEFRPAMFSLQTDFANTIEQAEKAMGIDKGGRTFGRDILRVELSGPKQPHLTLVDLPGLFHAGNKLQSTSDAEAVKQLVQSYMKKSRSVILAVISAKNDYANQIVTTFAREFDEEGQRTLGIITKPDCLDATSDSESAFVDLAANKDVQLKLGWHLLRNRDYDSRDCTSDERDDAEAAFFAKGIWASLPPSQMGIHTLKPRLSRVLKDQILTELPGLILDVAKGISECDSRMERLGESRGSLAEQRMYLLRVSQKFASLMEAAVHGNWADQYFAAPTTKIGYTKRLRAVYTNTMQDFRNAMNSRGHAVALVEQKAPNAAQTPKEVTINEYIDKVQTLMKRTRGCELPGTFNPLIIGELFYEQSVPWQAIMEQYTEKMLSAARVSLMLTLQYSADQSTVDIISRNIIMPAFEVIQHALNLAVTETLAHQQRGYPITFNHYFTDTLQKKRDEEWGKSLTRKLEGYFGVPAGQQAVNINKTFTIKSLVNNLTSRPEAEMDRFACTEAIHCMESYYKVSQPGVKSRHTNSIPRRRRSSSLTISLFTASKKS